MATTLETDERGRAKAAYPDMHGPGGNPLQTEAVTDPAAGDPVIDPTAENAKDDSRFDSEQTPVEDFEANPNPLVLDGPAQLSFDVGGETPTESSLTLRGGKLDLGNTAYRKGQEFNVTLRLKVTEVGFIDSHDSQTGQVVATRRAHVARVVAVKA